MTLPGPRVRLAQRGVLFVLIATAASGIALLAVARSAVAKRAEASRTAFRNYMEYAVGIAADAAQWDVLRALRARMQISPRGRLFGEFPGTTTNVTIAEWGRTGVDVDACRCLAAIEEITAFRYDLESRRLDVSVTVDPAIARWATDTLSVLARSRPDAVPWIEAFSSNPRSGLAIGARVVKTASSAVVFGFIANVRPWIGISLGDMFERSAMFPAGVSRRPNASIVRWVARTSRGDTLFDSGALGSADNTARIQVQRGEFGGMMIDVAAGAEALSLFTRVAEPRYGMLAPLAVLFLSSLAFLAFVAARLRRDAETGHRQWLFANSVSHELRTPLAQILFFAERIRERLRSTHDAELRHETDVIVRETERMRYLIENVLHVGRPGAATVRREPARIAPIVEEVVDRYDLIASASGVTISFDVGTDLIAPIDRAALEQILLNLLDNAVKHAGPGSVSVGVGMLDDRTAIWVDDAGPGIPAHERSTVWEPFTRGKRAREATVGGNGLGLSVVRDLTTVLGARATIDTSPLGGVRAIIWLANARPIAETVDI